MFVIDFETHGIARRPDYPPVPVGVSIGSMIVGTEPRYYGWGHESGVNNCTKEEAIEALRRVWRGGLLFHNAKFDLEVAYHHMGMPEKPWDEVHDTMLLLFLHDPYAPSFGLKQSAERLLGEPPAERDAVRDWLIEHKIVKKAQKDWGAHIWRAPCDLVGAYANGDVVRTRDLWFHLYDIIEAHGMLGAYDRERELSPILMRNEQQGIRVDVDGLVQCEQQSAVALETVSAWLCQELGDLSLNLDSDNDLADALERCGIVTEWQYTKTGRKSVAKDTLKPHHFSRQDIRRALGYRSRLSTCLNTFIRPWLETAATGGRIYTSWNQVRQVGGGFGTGAKTGRLSSSPNFQNIPKSFEGKNDGYEHPSHLDVPELPILRRYLLPEAGQVWAHRDYSQQELRITAHFEDAFLFQSYLGNPRADMHSLIQGIIRDLTGKEVPRSHVKQAVFGVVYGIGYKGLADLLSITYDEAKFLKNAVFMALPGIEGLAKKTSRRGKSGGTIRTWGGRLYYVEPSKEVDGEIRSFEYRLLNYLVQGSAADCTKQALINYDKARKHGRMIVTVHDEINISVPPEHLDTEMQILRDCMGAVEFDLPMLSDGKFGETWGSLRTYEEKEYADTTAA